MASDTGAAPLQVPTLRELLLLHCFDRPPEPLRRVVAELEKTISTALLRAAKASAAHPPFSAAALAQGTGASNGPPNVLRVLDVGYVRVDGRALWPDESSELQLWPQYAPLSLEQMIAPPQAVVTKKLWKVSNARTLAMQALVVKVLPVDVPAVA